MVLKVRSPTSPDLILQQRADDRVVAVEKSAVLHNRGALLADQIGAGANADPFFLAAERHVDNLTIFVDFAQDVGEIDVRQRGDEIDARLPQTADNCPSRLFSRHRVSPFVNLSNALNTNPVSDQAIFHTPLAFAFFSLLSVKIIGTQKKVTMKGEQRC